MNLSKGNAHMSADSNQPQPSAANVPVKKRPFPKEFAFVIVLIVAAMGYKIWKDNQEAIARWSSKPAAETDADADKLLDEIHDRLATGGYFIPDEEEKKTDKQAP